MKISREKILKKAKNLDDMCRLCIDPSHETQILLSSLKNKLMLKIKEMAEDYEISQERTPTKPISAFCSLLNIVFGEEIFSLLKTDFCSHQKIFLQFKKRLRCTHKTLKQASEALSYDLGSRNYHFQLLNQQISSVSNRLEKKIEPKSLADLKVTKKQFQHHSLQLKWLKKNKKSIKKQEKMNQAKTGSSEELKKEENEGLGNEHHFDFPQGQNIICFNGLWYSMSLFYPTQYSQN